MALCPKCGNQAQGAFCMRCGSPVPADAPQPPQQPQQPPPTPGGWQQQQPPPSQQPQYGQQPPQYGQQPPQYGQPAPASAGMEENVASALCYFLGVITGVLFLVLEPYNKSKTVRFHAFQSIFFSIGVIVLNITLSIVFAIMRSVLPYSMWIIFTMLSLLMTLCFLGAWIFLMYKAYNRERFKIPIIGDLAEKQA